MSFVNSLIVGVLCLLGGRRVDIPTLKQDSGATVAAHRDYIHNTVMPWYDTSTRGTFFGVGGVSINYRMFPSPTSNRKAIIFLHGASEMMAKYAEFLYDLRRLQPGYDIWFMEHRGMGSSARLIPESRYLYVDEFEYYVRDVKTFYDSIVTANNAYLKVFFWAHSMGGAVATAFAQQYPNDVQGLMMSAPMMEILTKFPLSLPEDVASSFTCASTKFGQGKALSLDQELPEPLVDPTSKENWENETTTTSWKRWTVFNEQLADNLDWLAGGGGTTWGATNRFGCEAYSATFRIRSRGQARRLTAPVLLMQAGDDFIVGSRGQEILERNARNAQSFTLVTFEGAYHELYFENDRIRDQVLTLTSDFLDTY